MGTTGFMGRARRALAVAAAVLCMAALLMAGGCGSSPSESGAAAPEGGVPTVRVGTMPTEDLLPLWVAQDQGLFAQNGVDVQIVVFDSAQNLSTALTAGEVDMAMTDPMRAIKLCESGTPVDMEWVTLGTEPSQGRFGVLAPADAPYGNLQELAAWCATAQLGAESGVGVASNTVPEYVFDMLCQQAGVPEGAIPTVEVPSLPDRYGLVASGNLIAAALPGSMLALGEQSGLKLLADDTTGANVSQSVMVARQAFKQSDQGQQAIAGLRASWDAACNLINADPEAYRGILIANANLNDAVAGTYPIPTYPLATTADGQSAHPQAQMVEPVVQWMVANGYASSPSITYQPSTGAIVVGE